MTRTDPRTDHIETRPQPSPVRMQRDRMRRRTRRRSLVAGAILAALLSAVSVTVVARLWTLPMHVPFQVAHVPGDDQEDATLDMMLIKNIKETGWFDTNPHLNAPFQQRWAEWPMGGDVLAYTMKKGIVETTGDVPLTFNLFWLLTFPLTALVAFPVLRALRCSWAAALLGAVLFSVAPYHFRNGAAHENLAFYVGIPIIVLLCVRILGPDSALPSVARLRHRDGWQRIAWLLLGVVLVAVTGIYYLAFLLSLLAICATVSALARRRPGRLIMAGLFGTVGLVASAVANLPTLVYRATHAANPLGVPDRLPGASELYPLRLVELLSPVPGHRFGPFATIATDLAEPGRLGFGTAELGLAATIGFVCAVVAILVRAVRAGDRRGWSFEARLGIVMIAALFLAMKGGLSRILEYVGLEGVRAWNRIAIVIAFASIVVFARLLDRLRVAARRRQWPQSRMVWCSVLVIIGIIGTLDQASPVLMPNPQAQAKAWHADGAFVASLQHRLPRNAMVFELPVVDFPEHGGVQRLSAHDLIKEGYLHSTTLRWSAGGVRGRDGEWQWPASALPIRQLVRGVTAMGFSAVMLDRYGFVDGGVREEQTLRALLGPPIATRGDRLLAWDLRRAGNSLLGSMSASARHALAQRMLDAPLVYLSTDDNVLVTRGTAHDICATGSVSLVNRGPRPVREVLEILYSARHSAARSGRVTIGSRSVPISVHPRRNLVPVVLPRGTTKVKVAVDTPGVHCGTEQPSSLPSVSAMVLPVRARP